MYTSIAKIKTCKLNTAAVEAINIQIIFQNKFMMWFGGITFLSCVSYICYMKYQYKDQKVYTAIDDNNELVLTKKRSGWD